MNDIIEDRDFWLQLEFVASGWLSTASEKDLRGSWIDGFAPSTMRRTNAAAEIEGTAWVMRHKASAECAFFAVVPWKIVNRGRSAFEIAHIAIDWNRKVIEVELCREIPA